MKRAFLLIIISFSTLLAQAQPVKYSNDFMGLGVGARAFGMGKAMSAISDDATSSYWNPAGLVLVPSNIQLYFMHSEYMAGLAAYDYGAFAFKADEHTALGLSYLRFGIDDIPDTSELIDAEGNINMDKIRSFSASDNAFCFSFARKLKSNDHFRYGVNARIIRRTAGTFANAWGFGFDAGLQYHNNKLMLAFVGKDITTTFNAWEYNLTDEMKEVFTLTGNKIPESSVEVTMPSFVIGGAYRFDLPKDFSVLLATDLVITTDGKRNVLLSGEPFSLNPSLGVEIQYDNIVFLRGGLSDYQKATDDLGNPIRMFSPAFGVGICIKKMLTIDYALVDAGDKTVALYSNVFSVKLNIKRKD